MSIKIDSIRFCAGSSYLVLLAAVSGALLWGAVPANADVVSMHCNNYTVTVTSDGPANSLTIGNNGCGVIGWGDNSNNISLPHGNMDELLDRSYTLTFQADPGWQFTDLTRFFSEGAWGGFYSSFSQSVGPVQITDLGSNSVTSLGPWSSSGLFDGDAENCCNEGTSWELGTGMISIPLPGSGFQFIFSTQIIGHTPDGGHLSGEANTFGIQIDDVTPAPAVPEPSGLILFGTSLLAVGWRLRKF